MLPILTGKLLNMDSLGDERRIENRKRLGSRMTSAKEAGDSLNGRVKTGAIGGEMCGPGW